MPVSFVRLVFFLCFSRRRIRSADRDPPDGYRRERALFRSKLLKLRDTDGYQKQFQ